MAISCPDCKVRKQSPSLPGVAWFDQVIIVFCPKHTADHGEAYAALESEYVSALDKIREARELLSNLPDGEVDLLTQWQSRREAWLAD